MKITKIEIQKKNKSRYNLYSDDIFLFGVNEDTLLHFSIFKGKEFSDAQLQEILNYEKVSQCLNQAYRYLSRRPHLAKELQRKLLIKKYEQTVIDHVFKLLEERQYLDDKSFIRQFIQDEIYLKKSGPLRISQKLFLKGAAAEDIKEALDGKYPEEVQLDIAGMLVKKKWPALKKKDPSKARQRLFAFLRQKGFETDLIRQVMPADGKEVI